MDVPVVAAAGLKGHVENGDLPGRDGRQIALPHEKLPVGVLLADGEEDAVLVGVLFAADGAFLVPDLLGLAEHGPALGPAHIHGGVGDDGGDLLFGDAVVFGVLQMVAQGGIGDAGGHQRHHGDDALGLQVQGFLIPDLTEQHVVVEMGEAGGKISQLRPPGGLCDLLAHFSLLIV